jgi:hypothetical protein
METRTKIAIGVGAGLGGGLLLMGLLVLVGVVVLRPAFEFARNRKAYVPYASPECTLVVTDMEVGAGWGAGRGGVVRVRRGFGFQW